MRPKRTVNFNGEIFTEGATLEVLVLRKIFVSEVEPLFLVRTPAHNLLLIPEKPYENYFITEGSRVHCMVDKINCSGRIFLEPTHPRYTTGEVYRFKTKSSELFIDHKKRHIEIFYLSDEAGIGLPARFTRPVSLQENACFEAKFISAKKGIFMLELIRVINNS